MAWVEKGHSDHPVPTPCYVQGRQPADQAAQSHIQPGLECLQGWGIHSLLGQPVQCLTTQKTAFLGSDVPGPWLRCCLAASWVSYCLARLTEGKGFSSCLAYPSFKKDFSARTLGRWWFYLSHHIEELSVHHQKPRCNLAWFSLFCIPIVICKSKFGFGVFSFFLWIFFLYILKTS